MTFEFRTKSMAQNDTNDFCGISTKNMAANCMKRIWKQGNRVENKICIIVCD